MLSRSVISGMLRSSQLMKMQRVFAGAQNAALIRNRGFTIDNFANATNARVGTMNDLKVKIHNEMGIESIYSPLGQNREHLIKHEPTSMDELPPRMMSDSFSSAIIPLKSDLQLQDKYVTFLGQVRLGRLMEDMDLFAVWVVYQHVHMPKLEKDVPLPYTFVTILVDKIVFTTETTMRDSDIRLSGHVSWVGSSSVEVVVWLEQQCEGAWRKLTRALFLIGARNSNNTKAQPVNPLNPITPEEQKIFDGGESRKRNRKLLQNQSLLNTEPNTHEQKLIHDIFVRTIDLNTKSFNRRVLPSGSVWMEDAVMSNIIFSHPEDRNAHNKVFGGFLMRHALELSWALAYQHSKQRPKLENIHDIAFHRPVDVSSLITMTAHVIYTDLHCMEIVVVAEVSDAQTGGHSTTNVFYYTYSNSNVVPQIVPKTYHEAMWYLEGRRKFNYSMGLTK